MNIPKSFKIAGGKQIIVQIPKFIKSESGFRFGDFNDCSNIIRVANKVKINSETYSQTEEDKERTFYHELFHCFQFYAGMDMDEMVAQTFSNFMYEYTHSANFTN